MHRGVRRRSNDCTDKLDLVGDGDGSLGESSSYGTLHEVRPCATGMMSEDI